MKTFIQTLIILAILPSASFKGYSQDSITVKQWQLKATINLGLNLIPDSIADLYPMLREDTTLKKNNWMVDKSQEDSKIEWISSIYLYKKNNTFYILQKFDTLIYPASVQINNNSSTKVPRLIKINSKNKKICFLHGYSNKAIPDSIFILDDNLIFISGEKSKIPDLNYYKSGDINFSSTAKLNSIYDLFDIDKYVKLIYKGKTNKLTIINEFVFVNEVKIKNFNEEIKELDKRAKYTSKVKKGIFDNIFEGDKKKEIK